MGFGDGRSNFPSYELKAVARRLVVVQNAGRHKKLVLLAIISRQIKCSEF
jgi:hypothetical protein